MDKISRRLRAIQGRDNRRREAARENINIGLENRNKKHEKVKKSSNI